MSRDDMADVVYKSIDGKFNAVVEEIVERHSKNQPVLVGTFPLRTLNVCLTCLNAVVSNIRY